MLRVCDLFIFCIYKRFSFLVLYEFGKGCINMLGSLYTTSSEMGISILVSVSAFLRIEN